MNSAVGSVGTLDRVGKVLAAPAGWMHFIGCAVTLVMMAHVVTDVIAKSVFNAPIDGTLEIVASYYMVVVIFASLSWVTNAEGHIMVELFTRNMSEKRLAMLDALVGILTVVFMVFVTWRTAVEAVQMSKLGKTWDTGDAIIDVWPSYWIPPISFTLMTAYVLLRVFIDFRRSAEADHA